MFLASALPTDPLAGPFVLRTRKGGFPVATAREVEQLLGTNTEDSVTVLDRGTGKTLTRTEFLELMHAREASAPPLASTPSKAPITFAEAAAQPEHDASTSPEPSESAQAPNRRRSSDRSASVRVHRSTGIRRSSWGLISLGIVAVVVLAVFLVSLQAPPRSSAATTPTPIVTRTPPAAQPVAIPPTPAAQPVAPPPPTPAVEKSAPRIAAPQSEMTIPDFPSSDAEVIIANLFPSQSDTNNTGGELTPAPNGGWDLSFTKHGALIGGQPTKPDLSHSTGVELRLFSSAKKPWDLAIIIVEGSKERHKAMHTVQTGEWYTLRIPWTEFQRSDHQTTRTPANGLQLDAVQSLDFIRTEKRIGYSLHLRVAPIGVYR